MKTIKALLVILVLTISSQANAQKILDKWEDLSNVNQIVAKVNYVANEGRFDIMTEYTSILATYTAKLDPKAVPGGLGNGAVVESINKLKTQAAALDKAAQQKATNEEIVNTLKTFNDSLALLISQCKIE